MDLNAIVKTLVDQLDDKAGVVLVMCAPDLKKKVRGALPDIIFYHGDHLAEDQELRLQRGTAIENKTLFVAAVTTLSGVSRLEKEADVGILLAEADGQVTAICTKLRGAEELPADQVVENF